MKNSFLTVCHGQESLKNVDLGDKFLPQLNIGFSDVSVVQGEDCHMQADSSNKDYVPGNLGHSMYF